MNCKWCKTSYTEWCPSKDRHGIARMLADTWKLREIRKKIKKGRCPLHLDKEDVKHTLPSCPETMKWTMGFLRKQ